MKRTLFWAEEECSGKKRKFITLRVREHSLRNDQRTEYICRKMGVGRYQGKKRFGNGSCKPGDFGKSWILQGFGSNIRN